MANTAVQAGHNRNCEVQKSITQRLRTDYGLSIGVISADLLVSLTINPSQTNATTSLRPLRDRML